MMFLLLTTAAVAIGAGFLVVRRKRKSESVAVRQM